MNKNDKYSDLDLLKISNKVFVRLEEDAQNGNTYAATILKEIFDNSKGTGPSSNEAQNQIPIQNQPSQQSTQGQVKIIEKSSNTSKTRY